MEALVASEALFRTAFEHAAVGIAHVTESGVITHANGRFGALLGYGAGEIVGLTFQELTHPDDLDASCEQVRRLLRGETDSYSIEKRYLHHEGYVVWVSVTVSLLPGDPPSFVCVVEDVTARKGVEEALRQSEGLLTGALEVGHVYAFERDLEAGVVTRSPNAAAILGRADDATWGPLDDALVGVHPEDRPRVEEALRALTPERPDYHVSYRYLRPDGDTAVLEERGNGAFDDAGALARVIGLVADVTERARSERALRESEERLRQLAENFDGVMWMVDAGTGACLYLSPAAEAVWGVSRETITDGGTGWLDLIHAEDRERIATAYAFSFTSGEQWTEEFRLVRPDGELRHLRASAFPIRREDGTPYRLAGFTVDVTDAVRYREERAAREWAEEALRVKTAFLRNVSDELRNPLTSIVGFAEILKDEAATEEQRLHAEIVERSAKQLAETVSSILEMAQIEAGAVFVIPSVVDFAEEVEAAVGALRLLARTKGLEVGVTGAGTPIYGRVDRECLRRILRTLVGGGLKFTEHGGVYVGVSATATEVELRVQDTGIGINPVVLPYLFDGLGEDGRATRGGSVELGLVKRLVETLGGTIGVESEVGRGTTFTVRLPRSPKALPAAEPALAPAAPAPKRAPPSWAPALRAPHPRRPFFGAPVGGDGASVPLSFAYPT